jgi:hypothetical protein
MVPQIIVFINFTAKGIEKEGDFQILGKNLENHFFRFNFD